MQAAKVEPGVNPFLDDDHYFEFCMQNRKLRIERTADGEIVIMPPVGLDSGGQELDAASELRAWAKKDARGRAFGPSVEYILPSGAAYSPGASWVSYSQLDKLSKEEKRKFPHLCPEFVIEVRSPSDRLRRLKEKMQEWIDNGAQLGWLIDGQRRSVTVYRPNRDPEELIDPKVVIGEGPLNGFQLDMSEV